MTPPPGPFIHPTKQSNTPTKGPVDAPHLPPGLRRLPRAQRRRRRSRLATQPLFAPPPHSCRVIDWVRFLGEKRWSLNASLSIPTNDPPRPTGSLMYQPTSTTKRRAGPPRSYQGYGRAPTHAVGSPHPSGFDTRPRSSLPSPQTPSTHNKRAPFQRPACLPSTPQNS